MGRFDDFEAENSSSSTTSLKTYFYLIGIMLVVAGAGYAIYNADFEMPEREPKFSLDVKNYSIKGRILKDQEYFQAVKNSLREADESVDVLMYVFRVDFENKNLDPAMKLANTLRELARNGIEVNVLLSSSEEQGPSDNLKQDNKATARYLRKAGVNAAVKLVPGPIHSKLVLIDDEELFLSNHNWTWSALEHNAELAMQFRGEGVTEYVVSEVDRVFQRM